MSFINVMYDVKIYILVPFHIYDINIHHFIFLPLYLPKVGRNRPKHVDVLQHVCTLLYLIIEQLYECLWLGKSVIKRPEQEAYNYFHLVMMLKLG